MLKLKLSLTFFILLSVFGLGWLVNSINDLSQSNEGLNSDRIEVIKSIISQLNSGLDDSGEVLSVIENWPVNGLLQVQVILPENLILPTEIKSQLQQELVLALETENNYVIYSYLLKSNQYLSFITEKLSNEKNRFIRSLAPTLFFYFGIVLLILLWAGPLVKQLVNLKNSAIKFGSGELEERIQTSSWSYLTEIEQEFNGMAERLNNLVTDNKILSRTVSHELKTPVARLKFGIEALNSVRDPERQQRYLQRISQDIDTMEGLIESTLSYARLEEHQLSINQQPFNLIDLIMTSIGLIEHDNTIFCLDTPERFQIVGDEYYIQILINNLIQNADKYGNGKVIVLLSTEPNFRLSVQDNGAGFDSKNQQHLGQPFWRAESTRHISGHGMGLAIAQRIAKWHGYNLSVTNSSVLGGANFLLTVQ